MPLRERNRFLAACETIEKHEAANNEVAQNGLLRGENTDRRTPLERIRADHPKFYDQRKMMKELSNLNLKTVVEIRGLEPLTSCMPRYEKTRLAMRRAMGKILEDECEPLV